MKLITAPQPLVYDTVENGRAIFLAGSIEMGSADKWQDRIIKALKGEHGVILNPRRPDWDGSWVQSIDNPKFREQVEWELRALKATDRIVMYFDPNAKSPISLLELGLFACTGKMIVYCPEGFWRKGNVDIVCRQYGVTTVVSEMDLVLSIKSYLRHPYK